MVTDLYELNHKRTVNVVPKMRYNGGDFAQWQKEAKEKFAEILGMSEFTACDEKFEIRETCDKGDYTQVCFTFQSEEGVCIPCDMLIPNTGKDKYPLMICLQGHTTGRHMSLGITKYPEDEELMGKCPERALAIESVKRGYIAIAMEQRYMGELGHDENGKPDCCRQRSMPLLLLGRTVAGERVWDVKRLIDTIEKNVDKADMNRISCMGGSGGGTTTFYAACLEERITCALPNVAVCTYGDSIAAMHHCSCNYIPRIAKYFDMGDLGGLVAPRRMVVSNGRYDEIFPIDGAIKSAEMIKKLYTAAGAEEMFDFYIGEGGHQAYTSAVFKILGE